MKESVNKTFNQFKIHTQYSICEGAIKIDQLKDFCKKNKNRIIIFATHNRYFANMADCKIMMNDGNIQIINATI